MRLRLLIILPFLGLLPACAVGRPVTNALHLTKPKPAAKPAHQYPAPPATPSSVS